MAKEPKPPVPLPEIPESLRTPEFIAAWDQWLKWRRSEKRRPITVTAANLQFAALVKCGPAIGVEAIKQSIMNDWQGLFPSKVKMNGSTAQHLHPNAAWNKTNDDIHF